MYNIIYSGLFSNFESSFSFGFFPCRTFDMYGKEKVKKQNTEFRIFEFLKNEEKKFEKKFERKLCDERKRDLKIRSQNCFLFFIFVI